ncbi:MAG: hypothetical protein KME64_12135 [Scytonematopsis contorta HA4267-MV1]|jgi:hypothetical protein|nr:hypothetical protein [Scytonematopsis contorta HA4267-MV1]
MTQDFFPFPSADSLERLRVHDDLIINAERWKFAHSYHRQRQNLIYQSLNQPGIVTGLGVKVIDSPENVSEEAKKKHWIEIQPGVAIDINGNPIVVNSSLELLERCYPIAVEPPKIESNIYTTIYIYIQYRDPDNLEVNFNSERIVEGVKITTNGRNPPAIENGEIELCRIQLESGFHTLSNPENPLSPKINEIDLTHRIQAHCRSLAHVRVGCAVGTESQVYKGFRALINSLDGLFNTLQGNVYEEDINLKNINLNAKFDLLYFSIETFSQLRQGNVELDVVKDFLNNGGTLIIEVDAFNSDLEKTLEQDLLSSEVFIHWHDFENHNFQLLKYPFLFTSLPIFYCQGIEIKLSQKGQIILITERFLYACSGINLSRNDIRVAHELGINLLYLAWQRRHLHELMK